MLDLTKPSQGTAAGIPLCYLLGRISVAHSRSPDDLICECPRAIQAHCFRYAGINCERPFQIQPPGRASQICRVQGNPDDIRGNRSRHRNQPPPFARKHRPWWSNHPSNNAVTRSWLAVGYRTSRVDIANERLVFIKVDPRGLHDPSSRVPEKDSGKHPVFGCLAGTVTVAEDLDLTSPAMSEWADMAQRDHCHD